MDRNPIAEDTRTTVATALALWGGTVLAAGASDVFAKLSLEEFATLAVFATAFALAASILDPEVREFTRRIPATSIAIALDAVVVTDAAFIARTGNWESAASAFPHALVALFVLPLAAALSVAASSRRGKRAVSSLRAKSPAATRAAT